MSGSVGLATNPLSDAERADVRRFCGYPAYGSGNAGFSSWRFFSQYGELEFRMTNLAPAELQIVRQYLASLYPLESAIPTSASRLSTDSAAVWYRNKNEVNDRLALLVQWGRKLADFMGVPFHTSRGAFGAVVI